MNVDALSRHALERMGQRGISGDDLDLILLIGTEVEDGYIVLNRDCQAAEQTLKRILDRIRRLGGKRVVVAGGRVVTTYRADKAKAQRLVRRAGDRNLVM